MADAGARCTVRGPRRAIGCTLLFAALAAPAAGETVELVPDGAKYWGARNLFAPFTSLFLGPRYWYGERTLQVETTPPDAELDLFYVRAGFQKRYEQTEAPATIVLPRRIDASPKDVVKVRAFAEGYRYSEVTVKVTARQSVLGIELEPLPNVLTAVAQTYFGGRASLSFLTKEALGLRILDRDDGLSVALSQTARGPEVAATLEGLRSPIVESAESLQLGEDLLVQLRYTRAALKSKPEVRAHQGHDPIRDRHVYSLDLVFPESAAKSVERARRALAKIRTRDVTGCAVKFDTALRAALEPAALARALTPQGRFTDPYLRAAMRRLGEVSPGGVIRFEDGTAYNPAIAIQLHAAVNQASEAKGYLALLRRFVELLEPAPYRRSVLRSLVAPELPEQQFATMLARAEGKERDCRRLLAAH